MRQFIVFTCITPLLNHTQKTVEVNARDPAERRYAPPALDERQQPMYDVDQSPEEIARTLLENFIGNCDEDGTESVDSVNDDKKTNDGGSSEARVG